MQRLLSKWRASLCLLLLVLAGSTVAADIDGSADYPGIGRFDGSEIVRYQADNYDATTIATAPVPRDPDIANSSQNIEGEITRIVYRVPEGSSTLEVFRNFETKIRDAGYETIFSGGPDQIHQYTFTYNHPVEILDETSLGNELWYLSAQNSEEGAETYLSLLVSPHSGGDGLRVRLIGARTKAMENRMVDAEAMQAAIADSGKVALYGIYFDTDSAEIKPESIPTLEQIAELMGNSPDLSLIVVGHTDNQGDFEYNRDLSRRRAASVEEALVRDYGIVDDRLSHDGVGYLAPAASNDSDSGRALNRRVELVKEN